MYGSSWSLRCDCCIDFVLVLCLFIELSYQLIYFCIPINTTYYLSAMLGYNPCNLNMTTTAASETSVSNYKTTLFKIQESHKMGIPYVWSLKYSFSRRTFLVTFCLLSSSSSLVSVQLHVLPLPPSAALSVRFGARSGFQIGFPANTSGFPCRYHSSVTPYAHSFLYRRQYIVFITGSH